jgi:hypothetical protein
LCTSCCKTAEDDYANELGPDKILELIFINLQDRETEENKSDDHNNKDKSSGEGESDDGGSGGDDGDDDNAPLAGPLH